MDYLTNGNHISVSVMETHIEGAIGKWLYAIHGGNPNHNLISFSKAQDYSSANIKVRFNDLFNQGVMCGGFDGVNLIEINTIGSVTNPGGEEYRYKKVWTSTELQATLVHEFGHVFMGAYDANFGHVFNQGAVMYDDPCDNPSGTVTVISDCEREYIMNLYNPIIPITVKNDFGNTGGGKIKVDGTTYENIPIAGKDFNNWRKNIFPRTAEAIQGNEQQIQDPVNGKYYNRLFNQWIDPLSNQNNNILQTIIAFSGTHKSEYDKEFNVTLSSPFYIESGTGGYNTIDGLQNTSTSIREEFSKQIQAYPQGNDWAFIDWKDADNVTRYGNPLTLAPTDHVTNLQGRFKKHLASNSTAAFTSTTQRKFFKSYYGIMHLVYESNGNVWYERSTDNGVTWQICNNGQPLSSNPSKLPSLAEGASNDGVIVVFQEQTVNGYKIVIKEYDAGVEVGSSIVHESDGQPYSENANPVVQNAYGYLMVIWEADADGGIFYPNGMYYRFGMLNGSHQFNFIFGDIIPGTSASSNTPALSGGGDWDTIRFALAYEEGNTIYFRRIKYRWQTQDLTISNPVNLSYGNGYTHNYAPSIIAVGSGARVAWVGKRYIDDENEEL
jgi:hypothetical protein